MSLNEPFEQIKNQGDNDMNEHYEKHMPDRYSYGRNQVSGDTSKNDGRNTDTSSSSSSRR